MTHQTLQDYGRKPVTNEVEIMTSGINSSTTKGPLQSIRVLDISTIIAGPLTSTLLADFGAEVVKVELPGKGDGLRMLPPHKNGAPLWWKVTNRNKKGVTLDLRTPEGAELMKQMVHHFDVLVSNFRPGTLERWGLGAEELQRINPKLTILRVSAFGQEGVYSRKPGFARIADAMSGFLSLTGNAHEAPIHTGYPIADTITGLYGTVGILTALLELEKNPDQKGQIVDVSLVESMFRLLDFLPIEYDQLGSARQRNGNLSNYSAPSNVFATRDKKWVTVAASTQAVWQRLAEAISRTDLIDDPRFLSNIERLANREELNDILAQWFIQYDANTICERMELHQVAAAPVLTIDEIFEDPYFRENKLLVEVPDAELGKVCMQGVHPNLSRTPGKVRSTGPEMGRDNQEVFTELLGLSQDRIDQLKARSVI